MNNHANEPSQICKNSATIEGAFLSLFNCFQDEFHEALFS